MRRLALLAFVGSVLVIGAWKLLPFWTWISPSVDSTPVVAPLRDYKEIALRDGTTTCVEGVILGPRSRYLRFLSSAGRPVRVLVTAKAQGYRQSGYATASGQQPLTTAIRPPATELPNSAVCVKKAGRGSVSLLGVPAGAVPSDSSTTVGGDPSTVNPTLTVLESPGTSRFGSLPTIVRHAAAISPLPAWLVWVVVLFLTIGSAAALAWALGQSAAGLPARSDSDVEESGANR